MVTDERRAEFSRRLNEALDDHEVPPKGKGRQVVVAKMFGVSQKGARKWLEGESIPVMTRANEIAGRLGVNVEWLLTGRGPMRGESTAPSPRQSDEHQPYALIHNEWMLDVLDSIMELWGELPDDNDYLSNLITDGYNKLVLDIRESDRARLKSVVMRSLREKYKGTADGGGDARKSPGEADHD